MWVWVSPFHNAGLQTLAGMNRVHVRGAGINTRVFLCIRVLEWVSLPDGQCLFVLCIKTSLWGCLCWAFSHLITVFVYLSA